MTNENQIKQAYGALKIASERIGDNNYNHQMALWKKTHKSIKNFKFTVTPEHKEIVNAMGNVLNGSITPEDAMALLWQYDTMKQRGLKNDNDDVGYRQDMTY